MGLTGIPSPCSLVGEVTANGPVSSGLIEMQLRVPGGSAEQPAFFPGQFAMLNRPGAAAWTFGRPLSILAWEDGVARFLYRAVGRGTREMAGLGAGSELTFLGPLGRPFPAETDGLRPVLIAGGVGLPPVWSWLRQYGAEASRPPLACFGARSVEDVPWALVGDRWRVAVEEALPATEKRARTGLVTDLVTAELADPALDGACCVMACGPWPMLRAVRNLAAARGWTCWLSLEEHMGCGYGVCKGCVVPVLEPTADVGWRPATCCQEGPVFPADSLAWDAMPPEGSP